MSIPHPSQSQLRCCKHQSAHLSLPLPILPGTGPLKAVLLLQKFPPTVAKFVRIVRNICILIGKKNGAFGIPNWIFCDSGTELFKTHKTRMNRIPRSSAIHGSIKMECVALDTLNLVFICCGLHCSSYVYFIFVCQLELWGKSYIHAYHYSTGQRTQCVVSTTCQRQSSVSKKYLVLFSTISMSGPFTVCQSYNVLWNIYILSPVSFLVYSELQIVRTAALSILLS